MTAAAAGASPDVASGGDWFSPEWGLTGVATDLLPRVKASKVDMSAFWESLFQENYWDGKLYGFSYSPDLRVMFIRSESYLEAGLDPENPPQYWDEMEEVVVKDVQAGRGGQAHCFRLCAVLGQRRPQRVDRSPNAAWGLAL